MSAIAEMLDALATVIAAKSGATGCAAIFGRLVSLSTAALAVDAAAVTRPGRITEAMFICSSGLRRAT